MTLVKVTAGLNDVLTVEGIDSSGKAVTVVGWQSAMTNYYPPSSYDADGNLKKNVKPRAMTDKEQKAYWQGLLDASVAGVPAILFGG